MDIQLQNCFLSVDDHEKAIAFYRDALGFEVRNDVSAYGMRWTTLGSPAQPGVSVVLEPPAADPGISPSDRTAIGDLLAKGLLGRLVLTTPDVDATFEVVLATGAEVVQEPMDQPYGVRDCAFRDPAGNLIRINQPRG
jgi:catechol 2,3-dioxygenase-like lactoylglutathione lyase family enzyme